MNLTAEQREALGRALKFLEVWLRQADGIRKDDGAGDATTTARKILIDGLQKMGADGLCNAEGDNVCGCGLDDFAPCESTCEGGISFDGCRPAKREGHNFYPMEEQ